MVAIATAAAIVASQALISGAFSLTRQAVQLGYCPRMNIVHTSAGDRGRSTSPRSTRSCDRLHRLWCSAFQSSSNLAAAYGIAVTGTMTITTVLLRWWRATRWDWSLWQVALAGRALPGGRPGLPRANLFKIPDGGWFPLIVVAVIVFLLMSTWKKGRARLSEIVLENTLPDRSLPRRHREAQAGPGSGHRRLSHLGARRRPAGAAASPEAQQGAARAGDSAVGAGPGDPPGGRWRTGCACRELGEGFCEVVAHYGFMETPDVPSVLQSLMLDVWRRGPARVEVMATSSIWGGRRSSLSTAGGRAGAPVAGTEAALPRPVMARWRKKLFIVMARNAQSATAFFGLPPNRVVELGAQIQF